MSVMTRAMRRAGVKLKYSEGFNPHPYLSIALPLPVGVGSMCELLDFEPEVCLLPEGLAQIINNELPEGIGIIDAYIPDRKFIGISWVEVSGRLFYDTAPPDAAAKLTERFAHDNIVIEKRTKRGVSDLNIAPHIRDVAFCGNNVIELTAKFSAQDPSVSPDNLLAALDGEYKLLAPVHASFTRIEIYDGDLQVFR